MDSMTPPLAATNSLLIKSPVGCEYLTPLGASSSRVVAAIVKTVQILCSAGFLPNWKEYASFGSYVHLLALEPRKNKCDLSNKVPESNFTNISRIVCLLRGGPQLVMHVKGYRPASPFKRYEHYSATKS